MEKKIGILTLSIGKGYGGILQNYALHYVLQKMSYDTITISREYKAVKNLKDFLSSIKNVTFNRINGTYRKHVSTQERAFIFGEMTRFVENNIKISEKIYSTEELAKYFNKYPFDAIIVGSDQTWRPKYSPYIQNYFLDFLISNNKIKKIAYAASFGTDKWEYSDKDTILCKNLIRQFDAISVRENSGVELCKKYFDVNAKWVLDPTLLINKEDYVKNFGYADKKRKGIFTYILDNDLQKQNFITYVSNKLKLPIFKNQPEFELTDIRAPFFISDYKCPPVDEWIMAFHEADYIVTDSFHGVVFSIIFNKQFIAIANEARGTSRFFSLLSSLGLNERLVLGNKEFDDNLLQNKIDYDEVNKKLCILQNESLNFLKISIESATKTTETTDIQSFSYLHIETFNEPKKLYI